MEVNISAIRNATESVLRQLREQNYKETSIANYRRFYDRLYDFMSQNSIEFYTEEVGQRFFDSIDVGESTYSFYAVAVRRINDFINGEPYRCHHQVADVEIPAAFTEAVNAFLTECERSGNKSVTIKQKKKSCGLFLQEIEKLGCTDLSCLNVQLVSQALLIFENKDHYAVCRQFLGFSAKQVLLIKTILELFRVIEDEKHCLRPIQWRRSLRLKLLLIQILRLGKGISPSFYLRLVWASDQAT